MKLRRCPQALSLLTAFLIRRSRVDNTLAVDMRNRECDDGKWEEADQYAYFRHPIPHRLQHIGSELEGQTMGHVAKTHSIVLTQKMRGLARAGRRRRCPPVRIQSSLGVRYFHSPPAFSARMRTGQCYCGECQS